MVTTVVMAPLATLMLKQARKAKTAETPLKASSVALVTPALLEITERPVKLEIKVRQV